jgi:SAM-dependent methyltransferase
VKRICLAAIVVLLCASSATAEPPRGTSDPYTGSLSIFEKPGRDKRLQVQRVMDVLAIRKGSAVADIGAGSGWFSVRAARRVAKEGVVYAVDINPKYLRHIERRAKKEKLPNIRAIRGAAADPQLPVASVDAVLLLKTYHEIEKPVELLRKLRPALRPNARVGIIDRGGIGTDHGINADVVIREAEQAGYRLLQQHDFVKADEVDYFLVFEAS